MSNIPPISDRDYLDFGNPVLNGHHFVLSENQFKGKCPGCKKVNDVWIVNSPLDGGFVQLCIKDITRNVAAGFVIAEESGEVPTFLGRENKQREYRGDYFCPQCKDIQIFNGHVFQQLDTTLVFIGNCFACGNQIQGSEYSLYREKNDVIKAKERSAAENPKAKLMKSFNLDLNNDMS